MRREESCADGALEAPVPGGSIAAGRAATTLFILR
jgi:hypothetical protein